MHGKEVDMRWNVINIIGLALLLGIAVRYYKQAGYLVSTIGTTSAELYSVVSLQTPQAKPTISVAGAGTP